jgi:hypothetical protein
LLSLARSPSPTPYTRQPTGSSPLPCPTRRGLRRMSLTQASRHLPHTGLCRRPAYPTHISPLASPRASPPLHRVHQSPHNPTPERRA